METDHIPQVAASGAAVEDGHRVAQTGEFLVVGLGVSAGGIQALIRFFDHLSAKPEMAFVVIVHLSPEHESNLAPLLQQHTTLPVTQVNGAVVLMPNHVYVIPPAKYLALTDGTIHLAAPIQGEGRRAPIDHFFRTLADTHGVRAAGVVLSGSGADGTIGLPRIKEMGGVTLVQDPNEAEYDEMPRSAIGTGLADYVLPVADMPAQLISYWAHALQITLPVDEEAIRPTQTDQLAEILAFLRTRTGHNFAAYKRATVIRRIERRMQVNEQPSLPEYLARLRHQPAEVKALLRDLLISVTNFFRDDKAWETLETTVIPHLFQNKEASAPIRVWVAGCATGEEAYSLAILLYEYTRKAEQPANFQVFATDLDERAIALAREGRYPETIALDVSAERLRHFFIHEDRHYRVSKEIRDTILFAVHDVLKDPPFSRLDMISCRNLLIYLNKDAQEQLLALFHFALKPEACLFLGMSESTDGVAQLYSNLDKKYRLFTRRTLPHTAVLIPSLPIARPDHPPSAETPPSTGERTLAVGEIHSNLLERYAPPSVVVNENYEVVHLSNRAGRYLQFVGGEPSYNLIRVIHPALRLDLRSALYTALQRGKANETQRISMQIDGSEKLVRLIVHPVREPEALRGYGLVIFDEIDETPESERAPGDGATPMARQLEEEVQLLRDQLRVTIEQHETSVEELRASNEELQAMNEELRSASEELETSREELQAVNEELLTVNQELKSKVDEVSQINSDLQNLMISTDIGTVFLDRELRVKRYTPPMQRLFNIIPTDLDRPLAHITHKLNYDGLVADARQVLQRLNVIEREIQTSSGEWFLVRLLPYRTVSDQIGGVVMTFVDVTERTRAAQERETLLSQLAAQRARFEAVVQQMPAGLIIADAPSGRISYSNVEAARLWGAPDMPLPNSIAEYSTTYKSFRADGTQLRSEDWPMAQAILQGTKIVNQEIIMEMAGGRHVVVLSSAAPLLDHEGQIVAGVMTWYDVSAHRELQEALGLDRLPLANGGREAEVYRTGQPYLSGNVDLDTGALKGFRYELGARSMIIIPLDVDGKRQGVIQVAAARAEAFTHHDVVFVQAVTHWIGMVAHRAQLVEQLTESTVVQARRGAADELITLLAHELNNHLTPIQGRVALLRRRATQEDRQPDLVDIGALSAAVERLRALVNDLLTVERLEQGLFTITPEAVDLGAVTRECVQAFSSHQTPVELHQADPGELTVLADPVLLRQALENLLANATKHSPEGIAVQVYVEAAQHAEGRWATVTVQDRGPGIPAEILPRLFDRFTPGPGSSGIGLGLFMARRIAEAHAGRLTYDPATEGERAVRLALPLMGSTPVEQPGLAETRVMAHSQQL